MFTLGFFTVLDLLIQMTPLPFGLKFVLRLVPKLFFFFHEQNNKVLLEFCFTAFACLAVPQLLLQQLVETQQRRKNFKIFKDTYLWLPAVSSSHSRNPTQEIEMVQDA